MANRGIERHIQRPTKRTMSALSRLSYVQGANKSMCKKKRVVSIRRTNELVRTIMSATAA